MVHEGVGDHVERVECADCEKEDILERVESDAAVEGFVAVLGLLVIPGVYRGYPSVGGPRFWPVWVCNFTPEA